MNIRMIFIFLTVLAAASARSFAKSGKLPPSQLRRVMVYQRLKSAVNGSRKHQRRDFSGRKFKDSELYKIRQRRHNNLAANQWKNRRGNKNYFWNKLKFDFA